MLLAQRRANFSESSLKGLFYTLTAASGVQFRGNMRLLGSVLFTLCALLVAGCSPPKVSEQQVESANPADRPNFLILVADDLGVDGFASYGANPRNAQTLTIDRLAADGMLFTQFWTQPVCSPTRASALTGKYAFRHGVEGPVWGYEDQMGVPVPQAPEDAPLELDYGPFGLAEPRAWMRPPPVLPPGLRRDEFTLPMALKALGYATAAVGKWHLADLDNGWLEHPNLAGFDYFSGPLAGALSSLFAWQHVENGVPRQESGYVDAHSVDDALKWINGVAEAKPWFVWFSFVNPHEPFHKPPEDLIHSQALRDLDPQGVAEENVPLYFKAQIEAMDALAGRLLAGLSDADFANTYVIWFGDNGDDRWARSIEERKVNRYKITLYEGGVRVPFIAVGPGISPGIRNDSLGHAVDLFSTVLDLAGEAPPTSQPGHVLDSQSLVAQLKSTPGAPARSWNYTDINMGLGGGRSSAIRDAEYKLIVTPKTEELYHLAADSQETTNLVANMDEQAQIHYQALKHQLQQLLDP